MGWIISTAQIGGQSLIWIFVIFRVPIFQKKYAEWSVTVVFVSNGGGFG